MRQPDRKIKQHNRRSFLKDSVSMLGGSYLGLNLPLVMAAAQTACSRRDSGAPWANLTQEEAESLASVVDQIIPPDETPGASESGVVYFIDTALGSFMAGAAQSVHAGLRELDKLAGSVGFAGLQFAEQTSLLKHIEDQPFFGQMLVLTRAGMFALPEYGGNRYHAGWKLIGFEHRHVWQAPYGYYDQQIVERESENGDS